MRRVGAVAHQFEGEVRRADAGNAAHGAGPPGLDLIGFGNDLGVLMTRKSSGLAVWCAHRRPLDSCIRLPFSR